MRTPPPHLDTASLAAFVADRWNVGAVELTYAPVGFGSHHWSAETAAGPRFVTVDDLREARHHARIDALRPAMRAASTLAGYLPEAVGPHPARDRRVVQCMKPGFAVTVFERYEAAALNTWDRRHRGAAVELLARLHDHTDLVAQTAQTEEFALPGKDAVDEALDGLGGPTDWWMTGPYALPTRQVLRRDGAVLGAALREHAQIADRLRADRSNWVITHGEPNARNLLACGDDRLLLVDWDTARIAPAARDLWHVDDGGGEALRRYTALTGRTVARQDLEFYRLHWYLMDVCRYIEWFTTPHAATPDAEIGWGGLVEAFEALEQRHRRA